MDNETTIRQMADREFADHTITEVGRAGVVRCWRCAKPGTGFYSFQIATIPGAIIVRGDIGELIVERHYDMLPWCRQSVDSLHYFMQKIPASFKKTEFSPDVLTAWITAEIATVKAEIAESETEDPGLQAKLDVLHEGLSDIEDCPDPSHFYELFNEICGGDFPDWTEPTSNVLWCRDAIRWFVTHHDEPEITA